MSQRSALDRLVGMHRWISLLLALGLAVNGAIMLTAPHAWYAAVPGVSETGAYNPHFVRDIGCAFLVAALGTAWGAVDRRQGRPAALMGATFLGLHALVHVWDLLAAREDLAHLVVDVPGIFFPAVLAFGLALRDPARAAPARAAPAASIKGWLLPLIEPKLAAVERDYGYDTTYLRWIASVSPPAFLRFSMFTRFAAHREQTPSSALFAAKLAILAREDCGPCTQLVVRMAEQESIAREDIVAALAHSEAGEAAPSPDVALVVDFVRAVVDRDLATSSRHRAAILERWGEKALVTLAFAMASARVYPTLKYALGYGQACTRVTIGGAPLVMNRAAKESVR